MRTCIAAVVVALVVLGAHIGAPVPVAAEETPDCPDWADITISQTRPGSSTLTAVLAATTVSGAPAPLPSKSLNVYFFVDRGAGIYSPNRGAMPLRGGAVITDGSAQVVEPVTGARITTPDLQLAPGPHTVTAVLAAGSQSCVDQRPPDEPCGTVCGPTTFLIWKATEFTVGSVATAVSPEDRHASNAMFRLLGAFLGSLVVAEIAASAYMRRHR